jgi:hypothetical protein
MNSLFDRYFLVAGRAPESEVRAGASSAFAAGVLTLTWPRDDTDESPLAREATLDEISPVSPKGSES